MKLSRRFLLKGAGFAIGLPLLDVMMPSKAWAAGGPPNRYVLTFMGTCTGPEALTNPAVGALTTMPRSFASLQPVKDHVTIISKLSLPVYLPGTTPTAPGSALQQQHGGTISCIVSGVTAKEKVAPLVRGTSADQLAADFLGAGSGFASLQLRVQAAAYNGSTGSSAQARGMSVRASGSTLSELLPIESPARIYGMLVGATPVTSPADAGVALPDAGAAVSSVLQRRKSVLDFVLDDANRLSAKVGAADKEKLDLHFTHLRELEQRLVLPASDGGSASGGGGAPIAGCSAPPNPGADPAPSTWGFGGWAQETQRGHNMADLITYALTCDLTRAVSWMLTHDQCFLNSTQTSGSDVLSANGSADVHNDSHFGGAALKADNANWGAGLWGRLVQNLANRPEAGGTVLDHTFLSLVFAEGISAHAKTNLTYLVAGLPSKVHNGVHLDSNGAHPAQIQVAGLKAIGMSVNQVGEVSGALPGLLI